METLLVILAVVHAVALAVVNSTPTPAPGTPWAAVYRAVEVLAGLLTPFAKDPGRKAADDPLADNIRKGL